jgi:hypothetical protein
MATIMLTDHRVLLLCVYITLTLVFLRQIQRVKQSWRVLGKRLPTASLLHLRFSRQPLRSALSSHSMDLSWSRISIGRMRMNVGLFPEYGFPAQLTVHV